MPRQEVPSVVDGEGLANMSSNEVIVPILASGADGLGEFRRQFC